MSRGSSLHRPTSRDAILPEFRISVARTFCTEHRSLALMLAYPQTMVVWWNQTPRCLAQDTPAVMPRSLNDSVGFSPSCLRKRYAVSNAAESSGEW